MAYTFHNADNEPYTFGFASEILRRPVTEGGRRYGVIVDLVARRQAPYPELEGVVIRRKGQDRYLPVGDTPAALWQMKGAAAIDPARLCEPPSGEDRFRVGDVLMDKQIVDVQGAKVERVNDVHLLTVDQRTYVVHVDVGLTGLLRRLGFERGARKVAGKFGRALKDEFISWRYVQTLQEGRGPGPIRLAVDHADLRGLHPGELAEILEDLDKEGRVAILHTVDPEVAASALEEVEPELGAAIVAQLDPEVAADIMEEMEAASAADILEEVSEEHREVIIDKMEAEEREEIERLHTYEDRTAGALMTTDFVDVPDHATVADATAAVRRWAEDVEMLNYLYLVDDEKRLVGAVSLKQLILAEPATPLRQLAGTRLVSVPPDAPWDDVAEKFYKFNFLALPVIDADDRLLGVIPFKSSFDELMPHYYREAV